MGLVAVAIRIARNEPIEFFGMGPDGGRLESLERFHWQPQSQQHKTTTNSVKKDTEDLVMYLMCD